MNMAKQKQTYRYREQTGDYYLGRGRERLNRGRELRDTNYSV